MLDAASNFKRFGASSRPFVGKTLAMIFDRPSTRTRVSFEVAMRQSGGDVIVLAARDIQSGRGDSPADTARVLSRYADAIVLVTDNVSKLNSLARHATVPVINGGTDTSHPCQLMADVLTREKHRGPIAGEVVAWCGDGNNVARSWIEAAVRFGFTLRLATPDALRPPAELIEWARAGREDRTDGRSRKGGRRRALRGDRYLGLHVG
jgi:ornithine carbamoyltransferase